MDLLQNAEAVDVGHQEIQENEVRLKLDDGLRHVSRVARRADVLVSLLLEGALEQQDVRRLVVHDEDPRREQGHRIVHGRCPRNVHRPRRIAP